VGLTTHAGLRPPRFRASRIARADASVRLKAQEGMQSLVAENFMRVVGTHNNFTKLQKIHHLRQGSYFVYRDAYFYHPGTGFGNWISSFVYLRPIIVNHV
jgi:hypothetical protein